jgi:D-arabinose 1-dehydrogenase-like Zn-dependent alcohol dehydrogenase
MLAFTARHGIRPIIATFLMAEADRALDHTRQDTAGFRAVLVA